MAFPGRTEGAPVAVQVVNVRGITNRVRREARALTEAKFDAVADAAVGTLRNPARSNRSTGMRVVTGAMRGGYWWRGEFPQIRFVNVARSLRGYPYPKLYPGSVRAVLRRWGQLIVAQGDRNGGPAYRPRWRLS